MASRKKLDSFRLRDRFNLSDNEIVDEAQVAALRRAEIAGWSEVEAVKTSISPETEGEYIYYRFELYGIATDQHAEF